MSERFDDLTWKDIPWANMEKPLAVPRGTGAIIPEYDAHGDKTGNFIRLENEEYMRILGATAYVQTEFAGSPEEILQKLRRRSPGGAARQNLSLPGTAHEGMIK